ncbi:MAG: hypothetical protein P4L82_02665 [Ancalomicrobiaceae bacterium]|nr:hypothetical protein [Ancalomicrobiaceae bacterium]
MLRFARVLLVSAATLVAGSSNAGAADGAAFLADLAGRWAGSGFIRTSATDAPGSTHCHLSAVTSGSSIDIEGACDGAAKGAHLAVVLRWNADLGQVLGTFQGGAETGSANLAGRIEGTALHMQVTSSSGTTSRLSLTRSGHQLSIVIAGKSQTTGKVVTWVQLAMTKG